MNRRRGFTLIEVVVALAILSVSLAIILRIVSSSAKITHISEHYYQAIDIAETQLALLIAEESGAATRSGRVGDTFNWKGMVKAYRLPLDSPLFVKQQGFDVDYDTYIYSVDVSWGDRNKRHYRLSTVRIGGEL